MYLPPYPSAVLRLESDNPAAVKAQIVKALKAMSRSLQHGEQVSAILNRSQVWPEYRDQKHDLFITSSNTAGYLTGEKILTDTGLTVAVRILTDIAYRRDY